MSVFDATIRSSRFQTVQITHSLQSLEKTHGGQLCIDVRLFKEGILQLTTR